MGFKIIFESRDFVVVDKPSAWLSVPGRTPETDLRPCVGRELEKDFGRIFPVHRLDFGVSGVLVMARSFDAQRAASKWFEEASIEKWYEAVTEKGPVTLGKIEVWESRLRRGKKRTFESSTGDRAETQAQALKVVPWAGEAVCLWSLKPKTGRPHQLRFELSKRGFPIFGDGLYGAARRLGPGAIGLRAVRLRLPLEAHTDWSLPSELQIEGIEWWLASLALPESIPDPRER